MIDYKNDEIIKDIYDCAMTVFGHGIVVPSDNHPCGWDWLDFECVCGEEYIVDHRFSAFEISNGAYEDHKYEGMTLKEILEITGGKFLFEINTNVDWSQEGR